MNTPQVLFVGWQSPENRAIYPIARLAVRAEGPRYEFSYVRGVHDACKHGFVPFREFPDLVRLYLLERLPPLFTNRLMSGSRPDFKKHIARLGLSEFTGRISPEQILARSEGRKATDHLEITAPPEFEPATRSWIYHGFVRGLRHVAGAEEALRTVHAGDPLQIERDGINGWDARALLMLRSDQAKLGFVPHVLIEDLGGLLDQGVRVEARVARVNLPPAPIQQRLLVRFAAEHRTGFSPMSTPRFAPIAAEAMKIDLAASALHPA